jgi:hypothetical protein
VRGSSEEGVEPGEVVGGGADGGTWVTVQAEASARPATTIHTLSDPFLKT